VTLAVIRDDSDTFEGHLMIDRHSEQLLTLAQAAAGLPGRNSGKPMNPSSLWKWAKAGCLGIRLETVLIGLTMYTSAEAVDRFLAAVTEAKESGSRPVEVGPSGWPRRTPAQKRRASQNAGNRLAKKGA
jgi:hypothetical protein